MSDWLDSFREDTERIRLETEEIKKETERLREENRKLRSISPEKLEKIVKKSTIMTDMKEKARKVFSHYYYDPDLEN